jgi:Putative Flp pilus-assembly TadE/G-like
MTATSGRDQPGQGRSGNRGLRPWLRRLGEGAGRLARETGRDIGPRGTGEEGQIVVLLVGLAGLVLLVLGLGWDASNWFLGHRALDNLADGAAIAAAGDVDLQAFYASDGRAIRISDERALATVRRYLLDVAGDSGLEGVVPASVRVGRAANGPTVTVELHAGTPAAFLRYLHVVAPEMVGSATATAELREP